MDSELHLALSTGNVHPDEQIGMTEESSMELSEFDSSPAGEG